MGNILGVSRTAISQWENNKEIIPLDKLNIYANYFNVSLDYIAEITNDKKCSNKNDNIDKTIAGSRIKKLRKKLNLTQIDIAKMLNTSHSTISAYEINGNILEIKYDKLDEQLNSQFEQLGFNEKLDVFSEIIIKYDNATYFNTRITMLQFDSKLSGYEIANEIMKLKI